jgi:hypothetical protein
MDKKAVQEAKNAVIIKTDPRIKELQKIWPNAQA